MEDGQTVESWERENPRSQKYGESRKHGSSVFRLHLSVYTFILSLRLGLLSVSLADLVAERRSVGRGAPKSGGGSSSGGGGGDGGDWTKKTLPKVAATGGTAQVKVRHDAHLPSLSLRDG